MSDVLAFDAYGKPYTIPADHVPTWEQNGGRIATQEEIAKQHADEEYAKQGLGTKIATVASMAGPIGYPLHAYLRSQGAMLPPELEAYTQGVSEGLGGGVPTLGMQEAVRLASGNEAAKAYGRTVEESKLAHPNLVTAGNMAGLAGGAVAGGESTLAKSLLPGAGISAIGAGIEGALGETAARSVLGRAVSTAAREGLRYGVEGALQSGINATTEQMLGDHEVASEKVWAAMGLGGLSGFAGGAAFGGLGSLAKSGAKSAAGAVERGLERFYPEAGKTEEAIAEAGKPLSPIDTDAGLRGKRPEVGPPAFDLGSGGEGVGLRPNVFGSKAPEVSPRGPLFKSREASPSLTGSVWSLNPDAGLAKTESARALEGDQDVLRFGLKRRHPVSLLDDGAAAEAPEAAAGPIKIPAASGGGDLGKDIGGAAENKAQRLANDQAWKALGGGKRLASEANRYLKGGTDDVGEVLLRRGVLPPDASILDTLKNGTAEGLLPRIQAEQEVVGKALGDLTSTSPARIASSDVVRAVDQVAKKYEASAATRPIGARLRAFGNDLVDSLGINKGAEEVPLQDLLRERQAIDRLAFENAPLDPSLHIEVKRELRGKLEGLITEALDDAGGKLPGEVKAQYNALKRDYQALRIANDAATSATAAGAANRSFSLGDRIAGAAGSTVGALLGGHIGAVAGWAVGQGGGKLLRTRGNAMAAVLLSKAANLGAVARAVNMVSEQIPKSAKGMLEPPKRFLAPAPTSQPRKVAGEIMARVAALSANPQAMTDHLLRRTAGLQGSAPTVAGRVNLKTTQAVAFLQSKAPVQPDFDPLDPHPAPMMTDSEAHEYLSFADYLSRPMKFFVEAEHGMLTPEGAEVAKTFMPHAWSQLQTETAKALATLRGDGKTLPYDRARAIGQVLEIPTTPDQRPEHAAFLQSNVAAVPPQTGDGQSKATARGRRPMKMTNNESSLDRLESGGKAGRS